MLAPDTVRASDLQQVALVLLHDAVAIEGGEDGVDDPLAVILVLPLPGHQAGRHQPGVLPQPGQELSVDALLEAQGLVAVHKLRVLQHLGVLAAFGRRGLGAVGAELLISGAAGSAERLAGGLDRDVSNASQGW